MTSIKTGSSNKMFYNKPDFVSYKEFDYLKSEIENLKKEIEELKNRDGNQ